MAIEETNFRTAAFAEKTSSVHFIPAGKKKITNFSVKLASMKFFYFIAFFSFASLKTFSQCDYPKLPSKGNTIEAFIPKGWKLMDSISGDFNNDKQIDFVLVLASEKESGDDPANYECNRPLIILQKAPSGFLLAAYAKEAVLCKGCGGVFGDPYEGISLKKNVLNINHYGGSAWRWSSNFTFRFQKNQWQLIGCSQASYWSLGECEGGPGDAGYNLAEANFSTSKAHIVKTKDDACKPYVDKMVSFPKKPLVSLQRFSATTEYFPIKN